MLRRLNTAMTETADQMVRLGALAERLPKQP